MDRARGRGHWRLSPLFHFRVSAILVAGASSTSCPANATPCSCITARRRRKQGMRPFYGTGWAAAGQGPAGAPGYNPNPPPQGGFQQGPPVYSPPPAAGNPGYNQYGAGNQGYFGGQQSGVELQQPNSTYQPQYGGNPVYAPPAGPPPGKS